MTAKNFFRLTTAYGKVSEQESVAYSTKTACYGGDMWSTSSRRAIKRDRGEAHEIERLATTVPLRGLATANSHGCKCSNARLHINVAI
jgi:hypothetical protein